MIHQRHALILVALVILGALFSACSSGGSSGPSVQGKSVYWVAPQYFTDNTPLVPLQGPAGVRNLYQAG